MCACIAKLYEYLALNVILIFKFVSIQPIGDLSNLKCKPNLKCNTHMLKYYNGNLYASIAKDVKNQQLFTNLYSGTIMDVKKINYWTYMRVLHI
jgi:hypothetical protein